MPAAILHMTHRHMPAAILHMTHGHMPAAILRMTHRHRPAVNLRLHFSRYKTFTAWAKAVEARPAPKNPLAKRKKKAGQADSEQALVAAIRSALLLLFMSAFAIQQIDKGHVADLKAHKPFSLCACSCHMHVYCTLLPN